MKALLQNYLSESHPSRVRELKLELVHLILALDESHPSRVRELKQLISRRRHYTKSRTPPGCVN